MPGRIANPVWVDDEDFDVAYHVRRSALPRPGTDAQLRELVGRLMSRQLDRNRPLWEIYLVEGLEGGKVGVVTKTHHAMVDGVSAVDIGTVILDVTPTPREVPEDDWRPHARARRAGPGRRRRRRPRGPARPRRSTPSAAPSSTPAPRWRARGAVATGLLQSLRTIARPAPDSPLNVTHRRAAPLRHGPHRPRRLQAGAQEPRRHRQRRRARHRRRARCAPWLLTRGEAVGPTTHGPRDGAGVGARRRREGRARQPGVVLLRRPARRRGQRRHAAAPGELRDARPQGVGRGGRRRRARAAVGLRAADDPRARRPGRPAA